MPEFVQQFDVSMLPAFHAMTNVLLDWITSIVSTVSWGGICWWVLAGILWLKGYRMSAVQLAAVLVIGSVEGEVLKHVFHRVRPSIDYPQYVHHVIPDILAGKNSFPSGHTLLTAGAGIDASTSTSRSMAGLARCWFYTTCWFQSHLCRHALSD